MSAETEPLPWSCFNAAPRRWVLALAGLGLAGLVGLGLVLVQSGVRVRDLAVLGYPMVFLTMFLSGAAPFFPVPLSTIVPAAGALWHPVLVGLAAALGNATGECVNYWLGVEARGLVVRRTDGWHRRLGAWFRRYGFLAILGIAAVPNPIFHGVSLAAGCLDYSVRRFWLACFLGNSLKYTALAALGERLLAGLLPWASGL